MINAQFIVILVFLYFGFNCNMLFSFMVHESEKNSLNKTENKELEAVDRGEKLLVLFLGIFVTILFACVKGESYLNLKRKK